METAILSFCQLIGDYGSCAAHYRNCRLSETHCIEIGGRLVYGDFMEWLGCFVRLDNGSGVSQHAFRVRADG